MLTFSVASGKTGDTAEILALQNQNHLSQLSPEVLANGFVTTQLTEETLSKMFAMQGIWAVRDPNGTLAAYACANAWEFYGDGPFQSAAKACLPVRLGEGVVMAENSFQYGPVCVAEAFRGKGVLEQLVGVIKTHYAPRLEFGITFIDIRNQRSLAAHERKLGFQRIALLPFGTVTYHMLAFPVRPAQLEFPTS